MKIFKYWWFPTILSIFTSFFLLGSKSFWEDEPFSIAIAGSPNLVNYLWTKEFNMWIYYFILRFWLYLGTNEFTVRSLSAIFEVGSIPFIYGIGKKLFDQKTASLAAIFTSLNVFFVLYAQDARAYSLSLMLSSASTYFFILLTQNNKKCLPLYIVTSALSVYAHLFAALVILVHFVSLLFLKKKNIGIFLISASGIIILLLPLLLAPSLHSNQIDWIDKPPLTSLIGTYVILSGDFVPLFIVEALLILIFFPWKKIMEWKYKFLFIWLILPVLSVFIFSTLTKSIYQSVYFISLLPGFMILVSISLNQVKKKWLYRSILLLIITLSLIRLSLWYAQSNIIKSSINNVNEDWRDAVFYIKNHSQNIDSIIFYSYFNRYPFEIYNTASYPVFIEISTGPYLIGQGSYIPDPDPNVLLNLAQKYPRVWLLLNRATGDKFNRGKQSSIIHSALLRNYILAETDHFPKVDVELYILNPNNQR